MEWRRKQTNTSGFELFQKLFSEVRASQTAQSQGCLFVVFLHYWSSIASCLVLFPFRLFLMDCPYSKLNLNTWLFKSDLSLSLWTEVWGKCQKCNLYLCMMQSFLGVAVSSISNVQVTIKRVKWSSKTELTVSELELIIHQRLQKYIW